MGRNAIMDAIRNLFGSIDGIIYSLIGTAYNLLVEIAHFRIFDNETLEDFAARIYAILGIFMLFKLSFSLINYMINPDAFTDKEKGVQNLIKNIIIMFAMLIMCPWAFRQLWGLQAAILDDNIIPRFIFGSVSATASSDKYSDECSDGDVIDNSTDQIGNYMATMVLRGFYQPYNNADLEGTEEYENTVILLCDASTKNISYMLSDSIYNAYADLEWGWGGEAYIMEYKYVMSTIVGGFILLILVTFCLDVGARMVKLSFLQLIAPIPIISYIDPASGKNGIFKKWLKEVGSTWVSIFIKLIALFFAVAVIQHIGKLIPVDEASKDTASIWVQIFVILGALMFAKSLPKLLGDIFGINMQGGFSINPLKKLEKEAIGGKLISDTTSKTARKIGGFAGRTAKTVGALPFAAAKGIGRRIDDKTGNKVSGAYNNAKAKVQAVKDAAAKKRDAALESVHLDEAYNRLAKDMQSIKNDAVRTAYGVVGGIPGASNLMSGTADKMDKQIKEYDNIISNIDSMMKRANSEMIKYDNMEFKNASGNKITMEKFKMQKEKLEALRNMDTRGMTKDQMKKHALEISKMQTYISLTEKNAEQAYIDQINAGEIKKKDSKGNIIVVTDAEITETYKNIERTVKTSSDSAVRSIDVTSAKGLKDGKAIASDAKVTLQNDQKYKAAQARKTAVPK